jgi:hypothetical protein
MLLPVLSSRRGVLMSDELWSLDLLVEAYKQHQRREHGGVVPLERRPSRLALTVCEREEISRGVTAGESARRVAARLGRSPSTVTREIARHGGRRRYRAGEADKRAWASARRPQLWLAVSEAADERATTSAHREDRLGAAALGRYR